MRMRLAEVFSFYPTSNLFSLCSLNKHHYYFHSRRYYNITRHLCIQCTPAFNLVAVDSNLVVISYLTWLVLALRFTLLLLGGVLNWLITKSIG